MQEVDAWKRVVEPVVKVYKITEGFLSQERYGLVDQLSRG